jgi:O-methyltransferase
VSILKRLLADLRGRRVQAPGRPTPTAAPTTPPAASGWVTPHFALFNKMYREAPYDDPAARERLVESLRATAAALQPNAPGAHAFLADDLLVWFRSLGFLSDPDFVQACLPYADDALIRARIWRVYTLCWAARSCLALPGDYVDIGCYDGKTVEIIMRYVAFASAARRYYLYDLFDDPPAEARKALHGPGLADDVRRRTQALGAVQVVAGRLPQAFAEAMPERIAFAQIDLNDAEAELGCLGPVIERMAAGALLVLDDYGFVRYRDSQEREKAYFRSIGETVLELPTGQGLFVKR